MPCVKPKTLCQLPAYSARKSAVASSGRPHMRARTILGLVALTAGTAAAMTARTPGTEGRLDLERWYTVTIDLPDDQVDGENLPAPLADLGDLIEVRTVTAAGRRGTELSARLRQPEPPNGLESLTARAGGADPRQKLRQALREAKQLFEVGEIIQQEPQPRGHRPGTPAGKLIDVLAKRSSGEGVL